MIKDLLAVTILMIGALEILRLAGQILGDMRAARPFDLTKAEQRTLELRRKGMSTSEIAKQLHRSVNTIDTQTRTGIDKERAKIRLEQMKEKRGQGSTLETARGKDRMKGTR